MATGYSEPATGASGPPSPFRTGSDDQIATLFTQMRQNMEVGYAITDLQGLEILGQLLFQIEMYETLKNSASKMSQVFTEGKLEEVVELLKTFRPMLLETSDNHLEFCQRFNFRKCYEDFFTYIDGVSSRLISTAQENVTGTNFLLYLQQMKFDVANMKTSVEDKFNGYPYECDMETFHWNTLSDYSSKEYLPFGVNLILARFPKANPLPPWLFAQNSPIMDKVFLKEKTELKFRSPERACSICNIQAAYLMHMSVLHVCDHVFCRDCLSDWLRENCKDQWKCPTCKLFVDDYGSIQSIDKHRSVTFRIPPHDYSITVSFFKTLVER